MMDYEKLCVTEYQGPDGFIFKETNGIKLSSTVDKIVLFHYISNFFEIYQAC